VNKKAARILVVLVSATAVVSIPGWYHADQALHDSHARMVASTLEPIATLLRDDQEIIRELQAEPFIEKDNGILQSYLIKIRRDGVAKTARMKQRLDQLAENNTTLVTLITAYSPRAKTPAFALEANKFGKYAIAWRDRWNSLLELFMAGGDYPAAVVPFPERFLEAVQAEIAASR
jgi:hypothetical protein